MSGQALIKKEFMITPSFWVEGVTNPIVPPAGFRDFSATGGFEVRKWSVFGLNLGPNFV